MRYHFADCEITAPLNPLPPAHGFDGVGLLIRRKACPIGFILEKRSLDSGLSVPELQLLIAEKLKLKIVAAAVEEELAPPESSLRGVVPSLTVVICTRARHVMLARCLDSIRRLRERRDFEILVVDNAPPDAATADVVKARPDVRYVVEPCPGLDFARNCGWRQAAGDFVAFLDDDVVMDHGFFDGFDQAWRENPDAGAFTGLVMPLKLETTAQVLFELRNGFRRGFERKRYGSRLPGNALYPAGSGIFGAGCNMVIRRTALEVLGGFDEALDTGAPLPGGGDLDIFYRIVRSNHPLVYEPRMMVFHEHRATEAALCRQYYTWGLGFMAYLSKTYSRDHEQRPVLRRLVRWWFKDQLKQLREAGLGRHPLPLHMVWAELRGGVVGLCGSYGRSLRRTRATAKAHR